MRTEYTIRVIHENGKIEDSVYPKKYADEKAEDAKRRYAGTNCTIQYFKVQYNGNSFYKAEKIF